MRSEAMRAAGMAGVVLRGAVSLVSGSWCWRRIVRASDPTGKSR
jgi:hypothetical protein